MPRIYRRLTIDRTKKCIIKKHSERRQRMKIKKIAVAVLSVLLLFVFCSCNNQTEAEPEINPDEFSYDMLDLSLVADEIYSAIEISGLTLESVSPVTDETVLTELFYLDLKNVVSFDIRSAEGSYGVADVAIIRVAEGKAAEVMASLENRKDDRINEFRGYDVYDSYDIALEAEIYEAGELVVMLMLSDDDKAAAKEIIDYYLP